MPGLPCNPSTGPGIPVIPSIVGVPIRSLPQGVPVVVVSPPVPGIPVTGYTPPPSGAAWSEIIRNPAVVLSNADLTASLTDGGVADVPGLATVAMTAGQKVRIEVVANSLSDRVAFGVATADLLTSDSAFLGCVNGNGVGFYSSSAGIWFDGNNIAGSSGFAAGDVIDIDVDIDAQSLEFFVNGSSVATVTHTLTGDLFAAYGLRYDGVTVSQVTLVEPADFSFLPPAGYTRYGA